MTFFPTATTITAALAVIPAIQPAMGAESCQRERKKHETQSTNQTLAKRIQARRSLRSHTRKFPHCFRKGVSRLSPGYALPRVLPAGTAGGRKAARGGLVG